MNDANSSLPADRSKLSIDEIVATLKRIIAEDLNLTLALEDIDENVPLVEEGLALDSIVLVEMIGVVEDRLGFEFEDSDFRMRSFESLRTLADVILARLQKAD